MTYNIGSRSNAWKASKSCWKELKNEDFNIDRQDSDIEMVS